MEFLKIQHVWCSYDPIFVIKLMNGLKNKQCDYYPISWLTEFLEKIACMKANVQKFDFVETKV